MPPRRKLSSTAANRRIVRSEDPVADEIFDELISVAPVLIEKKMSENWMSWNTRADYLDPEILFGENLHQIVLSPIGVIHLYRQYFFDFETFLGPAVAHVWISPGGMVELFEVTRKRITTEREARTSTELNVRRESASTIQEDISSLVKEENSTNENFGITVSAGGGFPGIFHADASVNYSNQETNQRSEEVTHKHMRQQSEKLSTEIKRSYQTMFKTTTETEDIVSKKYVLQNTTNELVNYELRRKMRRIGIQVQHIGTTLCWQVYLNEAGDDIGVGQVVHIAKPADLSVMVPPEVPEPLKPIEQEIAIEFPWMPTPDSNRTDLNKLYTDDGNGRAHGDQRTFIFNTKEYSVGAPQYKYKLSPISLYSVQRTGENLPLVDPVFERIKSGDEQDSSGIGVFKVTMKGINFGDNPKVILRVKLVWIPTDPFNQEAVDAKRKEYDAAKSRAEKEAYVNAVKERITLASKIQKRPSDDLRKEERIIVFRRLIARLAGTKDDPSKDQTRQTMHVMSELIRTIFDVDKMLYFVAPDWWLPRDRKSMQKVEDVDKANETLTESDLVDWSSAQERDRDNYLVTEDSEPAEMGSSIGWLLQLDGDEHRNAFLNSPWIQAVIPIFPGMEVQAIEWLQSREVEGNDGLSAEYTGRDKNRFRPGRDGVVRIRDVIDQISKEIKENNTDPEVMEKTEKVFEKGFDPLQAAFKWKGRNFEVFDEWTEILSTDQVAPIEYNAEDHIP